MKLIIIAFLIALINSSSGQNPNPTRFIFDVVTYTPPNEEVRHFQCQATYFRNRHLLTTASCIQPLRGVENIGAVARAIYNLTSTSESFCKYINFLCDNNFMEVKLELEFYLYSVSVEESFIHPNYHSSNILRNNIAVLRVSSKIFYFLKIKKKYSL